MRKLILYILLLSCISTNAQVSLSDSLNNLNYLTKDSTIINTLFKLHYHINSDENSEAERELKNEPEIRFDEVVYSADSVIRVFRYSWENCGIYCYELDAVFLAYIDSSSKNLHFLTLGDRVGGKVDRIQYIAKDKYLVFSHYMSLKQGGGNNSHLAAYLVSIGTEATILWNFDIYADDQDEEAVLLLDYNDKTKEINYSYKFYERNNYVKGMIKTGSWLLKNGNFSIQNEKTVYTNE